MPTAVVTGANGGIGHELAKVLIDAVSPTCLSSYIPIAGSRLILDKQGYEVHAVDVNEGDKLKSLNCETSHLDVTSPYSIKQFKERFGDRPLDLLLNVAGMPFFLLGGQSYTWQGQGCTRGQSC